MAEADYRDSHVGRGWDYHDSFRDDPRLAWLWEREQDILRDVVSRLPPPRTYLDFACGTGRVAGFVAQLTGADTVGLDVSASMLDVAAQQVPQAELICADVTTAPQVLHGREFDLITAFQFFPNAQPALRSAVLSALVSRLSARGVLIFNNHQNQSALRFRLVKLRGRVPPSTTPAHDMTGMLGDHGLRVAAMYRAGVVPQAGSGLRPAHAWHVVDRAACQLPGSLKWATDVVYVAVRG